MTYNTRYEVTSLFGQVFQNTRSMIGMSIFRLLQDDNWEKKILRVIESMTVPKKRSVVSHTTVPMKIDKSTRMSLSGPSVLILRLESYGRKGHREKR